MIQSMEIFFLFSETIIIQVFQYELSDLGNI